MKKTHKLIKKNTQDCSLAKMKNAILFNLHSLQPPLSKKSLSFPFPLIPSRFPNFIVLISFFSSSSSFHRVISCLYDNVRRHMFDGLLDGP